VGEFHCYTTLHQTNKAPYDTSIIEANEDLEIDVHDHKYIKVSLVGIHGRLPSKTPLLNQLAYEHEITYATLKLSDFEGVAAPHACTIVLNKR
jgi:hypothetical protein